MVAMIVYNRMQNEQNNLIHTIKDVIAHLSEDSLEMSCALEPEKVEMFLKTNPLLDVAFMDVKVNDDIRLLQTLRSKYEQSELLIIADADISPMEYLRPDIRAASLLLRPYQQQQCEKTVKDFFRAFYREREQLDERKVLVIENKNGKTTIPFHQIYYIEVREGRIFVRLKNKEYSRYDSLDHVMEILPENFLRCHRSFVFNTQHLEYVKLSENTVYLEHGISVPLSRSYKSEIKEYINGLRGV